MDPEVKMAMIEMNRARAWSKAQYESGLTVLDVPTLSDDALAMLIDDPLPAKKAGAIVRGVRAAAKRELERRIRVARATSQE